MFSGSEKTKIMNASAKKSAIYEIKKIKELLSHCSFNSVVVFDFDNTLIESKQELGSDQWFSKLCEYATSVIPDKHEAIQLALILYRAVQLYTEVQAVEPGIVGIIKAMQDIGIPVLGLTARGSSILDRTIQQLKNVGIDFSRQWPATTQELISDDKDNDKAVVYQQGIIFCAGNDKGACLKVYFERNNCTPQHVIMADDKKKYLSSVQAVIKGLSCHFSGLHYTFLEKKSENVDMEKARIQLNKLVPQLPKAAQVAADRLKLVATDFSQKLFKSSGLKTMKAIDEKSELNNVVSIISLQYK
jgi:hypothetical protein